MRSGDNPTNIYTRGDDDTNLSDWFKKLNSRFAAANQNALVGFLEQFVYMVPSLKRLPSKRDCLATDYYIIMRLRQ